MSDNNNLKMGGIYNAGYGLIPKTPMRDKRISAEAKAIYSYLCAFAGQTNRAYPHLEMILDEVGLSEKRFYKHRKQLIDFGYISIEKHRDKNNSFTNNVYVITKENPHSQNDRVGNGEQSHGVPGIEYKNPHGQNDRTEKSELHSQNDRVGKTAETPDKSTFHEKEPHGRNDGAISNSTISNSSSSEEALRNIINYYEKYYQAISAGTYNSIQKRLSEGFTEEAIIRAYEIGIENENKEPRYINGIFKKWKEKNVKTLEEIKSSENRWRSKNNNDPTRKLRELTEEDVMGGK